MSVRSALLLTLSLCLLIPENSPAALPAGRPLPDVPISLPKGRLSLKLYRGKVVVLALISTTCNHCSDALAALNLVQQELAFKGFQAVAAAGDDDAKLRLEAFTAKVMPKFPVGYVDKAGFISLAALKPDARPYVPILLFIDRNGMVRLQFAGDSPVMKDMRGVIRGTVAQLLAEGAPAAPNAKAPAPAAK